MLDEFLNYRVMPFSDGTGGGAFLLQDYENGVENPVGYFSKEFLKHQ